MSFKTRCPECARWVTVDEDDRGCRIRCDHCDEEFIADSSSESKRPGKRKKTRRDDDDEDDGRVYRRKRRKTLPWLLIGGAVVALLFCVGVVVLVVINAKKAADQAGDNAGGGLLGGGGLIGGGASKGEPGAETWEGRIGNVKGARPAVTTIDRNTGLAFRLPIAPEVETHWIGFAPQPSPFIGLTFRGRKEWHTTFAAVVDRTTAQPIGRRLVAGQSPDQLPAPSPDGKILSLHTSSVGFNVPEIKLWNPVRGEAVGEPFLPYAGQSSGPPPPPPPPGFPTLNLAPGQGMLVEMETALAWHAWVGPDRLLTITGNARVDVWAMPARTTVFTLPRTEKNIRQGHRLPIGEEARGGNPNFALTPDARRIALPREGAVGIYDTSTGAATGRTVQHHQVEWLRNSQIQGIAYNSDGSKLAYTSLRGDDKAAPGTNHYILRVVDGTTGVTLTQCNVDNADGAFTWWENLLVFVDRNPKEAKVFDPAAGRFVAAITTEGAFRLDGRDGLLWVFFNATISNREAYYVCAYVLPPPGRRTAPVWRVTPDGVE